MNKFKVEDKVRRVRTLDGADSFFNMHIGDTDVIESTVNDTSIALKQFGKGHAACCFELFEETNTSPVVFNQNIHLIIQDKAVVLIDEKGNKGLARCNPTDVFDFNEAIPLAVERLLEAQKVVDDFSNIFGDEAQEEVKKQKKNHQRAQTMIDIVTKVVGV